MELYVHSPARLRGTVSWRDGVSLHFYPFGKETAESDNRATYKPKTNERFDGMQEKIIQEPQMIAI